MSKKLELLKDAIFNNEMADFILGSNKKYYLACPYADMPTDPDQIFDAFKEYYLETNNTEIWNSFEEEIIKLSYSDEGTWLSIYYLSMYLSYRKYSGKDFINIEKVTQSIENGLDFFKIKLFENKKWVGSDFENGLWGDSMRLLNIINKKFELNIFKRNNI